ncbi:ABC transporter permease [Bacillus taeanensis]|uniref:ABC transporter permease n=1 Tax=Bacillus taeanensis TaxID=273032 RepID=A0A366XW16_9BACI|nr:ABC transporter permease [Bacillus taeanensis]RBW69345.1 ABC transporter permease [Bacillus taeanensis]
MNKFLTVLFHTYITRIKMKSFIITTLITILFLFGVVNLPTIINTFDDNKQDKIAVLDQTNELFEPLREQLKTNENLELVDYKKSEAEAKEEVEKEVYKGYFILSYSEDGLPKGTYKSSIVAEQTAVSELEQALQQVKAMLVTHQLGLDSAALAKIYEPVSFKAEALQKGAKTEEELDQARVVVYILLFLLYISVMFYGTMIATEVATEKSSRVMEILISSVSPVKQMFGKIFGVALVGLTQYLLILLGGFLAVQSVLRKESESSDFLIFLNFDELPVLVIVYAVVFFLLGYLLFATLFAMLGSLVTRVEEVNQLVSPVTMIVVAAFIIAMFGLGNPNSPIITITSFIPFFTPMIMFLRIGMLNISSWEIGLSIGLLILTIVLLGIIGAKIYRGGVLLYGKSASLKDIKRALLLAKRE